MLLLVLDVVEECGNDTEIQNSARAAVKLRSKLGYVEMRGLSSCANSFATVAYWKFKWYIGKRVVGLNLLMTADLCL